MENNLNKKSSENAYILDLDILCKVYELAELKGKKPGESMEEELIEIQRANPERIRGLSGKDLLDFVQDKKILDIRNKNNEENRDV